MQPLQPKRKMQDVSFASVEEFLEALPEDELKLVAKLRELVFQAIPDVKEKLASNVPLYKRHNNICFIWPGSIAWGGIKQKGVRLGFTNGYLLNDPEGFLVKEHRKQVYWRDFHSPEEIDDALVLTFLLQAADLDEQRHVEKRRLKT
jgi:hypothetical protein